MAQENLTDADGSPVDVADAERVFWLLADNLGTIRDLMDNTGAVAQHYQYDAFGQILAGDTSLTRYLFTGREYDPAFGMQYNRGRWYDPHSGRFLSEDPAGFVDGANLYAYVGNGPTNAIDPWGTWAEPISIETVPRYRNGQIVGGMGWDSQAGRSPIPSAAACTALAEIIAGAFVPGIGEVQDAAVLADPKSPRWQKLLSTASLAYSLWTLGEGPNAGSLFRAADHGADALGGAVNSGGRLGSSSTRAHVAEVQTQLESRGRTVTRGGELGEEYIAGPSGVRVGAAYPDITATKNGRVLRINMIDTLVDGLTATSRELNNAARIRRLRPADHLLLIPKPRP